MFPISDFLIYCFVTAYTPGANNLLSMSNAARLGFRKSFKFNIGITAGFLIVMSVCTLFSSALYSALPKIKFSMQIIGAAYMLYLAWKIWKSHSDFEIENDKTASFFAGMVLQFMNPKIYIYAITAMSLYILPIFHSTMSLAGFTLILTILGASGSYVWALFGSIFCKFFAKYPKTVNLIMALLLVYCAVSLFL
ncbi:MAG TPA: LysE family transporter [Candidatus Anaerostipes excrementavium]|uniref:LysE family transporter n=1 Tax=Candidatus Anaerostipes excrementavium TaxID=2838463 RepID=A0A9D2B9U4_9FIRM|nr:LysE family transporter [uncultured Anaerostipes sp.]HIX68605.1 LysE family transporter [Candidatus Anaerostipes excrementavium]